MDIEEVAAKSPEKLIKIQIDPAIGVWPSTARRVAFGLGLEGDQVKEGTKFITNLYKFYDEMDCSLVEINPLVQTKDGRIFALDAKVNFDDNALFRHKDVVEMRDTDEEDPLEVEASKFDLNYIKLDGEVACMVNGAGSGHGDHGYHQTGGLFACQFSGRGRRCESGNGRKCVPHPYGR
jgi:succinyl-CoA synthetase beta subunit